MNGELHDRGATALRMPDDAASGAAAGVAAALLTSLFQTIWTRLGRPLTVTPSPAPPTEALAANVYRAVLGSELAGTDQLLAGKAVHYAMGAALGMVYVLARRRWPAVAAGRGAAFGLAVWATVEEGGLAALRLKPAPWHVDVGEHLFAASSHLVFGLTLAQCLRARAAA